MSANLISWILTILFVVLIASGFLIGLWRGLKKSTVNLVLSIVGVVIAFFVTPIITKAILGIKINVGGEAIALQEIIVNELKSMQDVGSLIEKNPNLETLFLNLPSAIVNVILFIVVTIVLECLLYVAFKIIAKTALKPKENEKKHRFFGGVVGGVKSFIIVLIAFMPFASLIGVASTVTNSGDYGITTTQTQVVALTEETPEEENSAEDSSSILPKEVEMVIDGLENNLLTKMCGLFGIDDAMFDYYGNFNLEGEKIVIREEIVNLYSVVDITVQLTKVDETYSFKDFNYEKIASNIKKVSQSPMFENIIADTLGEILMNYRDYSFIADSKFAQDNAEVLDALSLGLKAYTEAGGRVSDYFTEDINQLVDIAVEFGENGVIDEIVALEKFNIENVFGVLTSDENYDLTKTSLQKLFEMNILRDVTEEVAEKLTENMSSDIDPIGVSTEEWVDDDWDEFATSVASIAKRYANIAKQVDIMKVLENATILLDEDKNYNIEGILTQLGLLIDEARATNLLQNSEQKPIIDKLLNKYKLSLPSENVYDMANNSVQIKSYSDLFAFVSPSLTLMRDEGVYGVIVANSTANEKIKSLAEIVSENEGVLSQIILPLYQVEPTKSLMIENIQGSLSNDLIDLAQLSSYDDWKIDLAYISTILKNLNDKTIQVNFGGESQTKTYLDLVLEDNLDTMIDNMLDSDIDAVIPPVFYAKSTNSIQQNILTKIGEDLALFTKDSTLVLSSNKTFAYGNNEDQTNEFCTVLKKLLPLKESFAEAQGELKNVDKTLLGHALTALQTNAYRVELSVASQNPKTEEGIFKETFISLMSQFKTEYSTEIAILELDPDKLEEEIGVRSFAEENYAKIDFSKLMTLLASLEA